MLLHPNGEPVRNSQYDPLTACVASKRATLTAENSLYLKAHAPAAKRQKRDHTHLDTTGPSPTAPVDSPLTDTAPPLRADNTATKRANPAADNPLHNTAPNPEAKRQKRILTPPCAPC